MIENGTITEAAPAGPAKRLIHRLLAIGENRLHLLVAEVQEERDHLLDVICLAVGVGVLALLAGLAFSAALVVYFWQDAVLVLCLLGVVFGVGAVVWWARLRAIRGRQETLAATLDQLQKDRECFRNFDRS